MKKRAVQNNTTHQLPTEVCLLKKLSIMKIKYPNTIYIPSNTFKRQLLCVLKKKYYDNYRKSTRGFRFLTTSHFSLWLHAATFTNTDTKTLLGKITSLIESVKVVPLTLKLPVRLRGAGYTTPNPVNYQSIKIVSQAFINVDIDNILETDIEKLPHTLKIMFTVLFDNFIKQECLK